MMKAKADKMIILGLSDENIKRLKQNQPIKFNLKEFGMQDMDVLIFNGKDEFTMKKMMFEAGLINPDKTQIKDDWADKN